MAAILALLSSFATAIIGIWGNVITFITTEANVICLIPLVAWLFVLGVKSARSMYKG